ncbi:hypothetical protein [Companilactobacillus ginsenosidimutans]|uniref:WxL domain-containing protein n=1 Tax=Companilactobacillus ginsenosidimutans TaxID=1007676 RepID=A0A0H4QKV2_9LACO|nr:hypothetical protein [Companilactobacillus ginsenosidimutans]AKP67343.1 hypothetical protein ABM34_07180 [Companilactobacillus ginsenosidimutans]
MNMNFNHSRLVLRLLFLVLIVFSFIWIKNDHFKWDKVNAETNDFAVVEGKEDSEEIQVSTLEDDGKQTKVHPYREPSPPPIHFVGLTFRSGYRIQPKKEYYLHTNEKYLIQTRETHPFELFAPNYKWYDKNESYGWKEIPDETSENIEVSSKKPRTVYLQASTHYGHLFSDDYIYSEMAILHFTSETINAASVSVTTDADYLFVNKDFKNQKAHAQAHLNPKDSTAKVKFKSSDTKLATVDSELGEISVNQNHHVGKLYIEALAENADGTTAIGRKEIEVGWLLSGTEHAAIGTSAEYHLNGVPKDNQAIIRWHTVTRSFFIDHDRVEKSGKDSKFVIPNVSRKNNNTDVYAEIIRKNPTNGETKSVKSNVINLKVSGTEKHPSIHTRQTIKNITHPYADSSDEKINNVVPGDEILHSLKLVDVSYSTDVTGRPGELHFPIVENEKIESVTVNGKDLTLDEVLFKDNEGKQSITITNVVIPHKETVDVEIRSKITSTKVKEYIYEPEYAYVNITDEELYEKFNINKSEFNENTLEINALPIDFGTSLKVGNKLVHRASEEEFHPVLDVVDKRRHPPKTTLGIQVVDEFKHVDDSSKIAPISFRYFKSKDEHVTIGNDVYTVGDTVFDEKMNSVQWHKDHGLKLFIHHGDFDDGQYQSTLLWTISYTP